MKKNVRRTPVKVGEVFNVKVLGKGKYGDSFTKIKGFVVFFKGGEVGDEVKIKITKVLRNFALATLQ